MLINLYFIFALNVTGSVGGNGEVAGLHPVEVGGDELVLEATQRDSCPPLQQWYPRVPSGRNNSGREGALSGFEVQISPNLLLQMY